MRTRWMWVLGFSVATLSGLQACGSDGGARVRDKDDGSAGNDGTGARSSGGRGGAGGASGGAGAGGGGMMGKCNLAPCDQQFGALTGLLGGLGGNIMIKSCCVNDTTCGVDASAFGALLGGVNLGCIDPSTIFMQPPANSCDTAVPVVPVLDGGVVRAPAGEPDVQLDKACPCIAPVNSSVTPPAPAFSMPGCCRPNGTCGGSSHTLQGAGTDIAVACVGYQEIATAAAMSFGASVVVPADPKTACKYTLPTKTPPPEGGVPDAQPPVRDASTSDDGATPGRPDAGKTPEAGAPDPAPADANTD
jgi:hypothetical protein